jgi:3-phytase
MISLGLIVKILTSSLLVAGAPTSLAADPPVRRVVDVRAVGETVPVTSDGDSADDPAIWVTAKGHAWILGTDKKAGLAVYDLEGSQVAFVPCGRVNNVDVRGGVMLDGKVGVLAAATQRDRKTVEFFWLDEETGAISPAGHVATGLAEPYGMALGRDAAGNLSVFAGDKSGRTEQHELGSAKDGKPQWTLARIISMQSQSEGMICDDRTGIFYIAEESGGVWTSPISSAETTATGLELVPKDPAAATQHPLTPDVEGLAIAPSGASAGYLVVSSQGDSTFAVFQLEGSRQYVGSFRIVDGGSIDGVSETDGIELVTTPITSKYPRGLLVVQDGSNLASDLKSPQGQNFKYISWADVESALGLASQTGVKP